MDVFAPSLDELAFMLGGGSPESLAADALALGAAVVALKLGDRGLYLRTGEDVDGVCARLGLDAADWRDREVLSPCFRPRRLVGTTGAGDCTIAGLLTALLRGEGPEEAATAATAVGACCVEAADATSGIPPWREVAARIAAGWPRLEAATA